MLKIKRVYICNKCGTAALPKTVKRTDDTGDIYTLQDLPNGWSRPFGFNKHLCPECTMDLHVYLEFEKAKEEQNNGVS